MILYGSSMSPFVRKVIAFASEKGIELEVRPVRFADQNPDFRAASPFGRMPALVDGDFRLADSSAICHYLEAKQPDPPLIPAEPQLRGQTIWFEEFADTILAGCGSKMFFNRIVAPLFLNKPGNETVAESAQREELPRLLDYLEQSVPGEEGFLVGDRLTLADLAVASPFANFRHLELDFAEDRYARTLAYTRRILDRPSFKPWIDRESAALARARAAA